MSKTPIEKMLDNVTWDEYPTTSPLGPEDREVPYATHGGILEIGGIKLRCYRLSNGQTVFNGEDVKSFFSELSDEEGCYECGGDG
jgi:hypothetical protein